MARCVAAPPRAVHGDPRWASCGLFAAQPCDRDEDCAPPACVDGFCADGRVDAGARADDAGPRADDAGASRDDAGAPHDAGSSPVDAGVVVDSGAALVDAGDAVVDAGAADAGVVDAGAVADAGGPYVVRRLFFDARADAGEPPAYAIADGDVLVVFVVEPAATTGTTPYVNGGTASIALSAPNTASSAGAFALRSYVFPWGGASQTQFVDVLVPGAPDRASRRTRPSSCAAGSPTRSPWTSTRASMPARSSARSFWARRSPRATT